jgi:hypothetical protein
MTRRGSRIGRGTLGAPEPVDTAPRFSVLSEKAVPGQLRLDLTDLSLKAILTIHTAPDNVPGPTKVMKTLTADVFQCPLLPSIQEIRV